MSRASWIIAVALWSFAASALSAEPAEVDDGQRPADAADQADSNTPSVVRQSPLTEQATSAVARPPGTSTQDRLELDTTVVTGNRELPKVLYIVPWKKAELGDLPAQPFNTLLDEVLTPVDRDVFRREVTYFDALASADSSTPPAASGSEK